MLVVLSLQCSCLAGKTCVTCLAVFAVLNKYFLIINLLSPLLLLLSLQVQRFLKNRCNSSSFVFVVVVVSIVFRILFQIFPERLLVIFLAVFLPLFYLLS